MYFAQIIRTGGERVMLPMEYVPAGNNGTATLRRGDLPEDTAVIDILPELLAARAGDEGYYILPECRNGCMLCTFREREDTEYVSADNLIPIFGEKRGDRATLCVVTGMTYDYRLVTGVRNGQYYSFPRIDAVKTPVYEDIAVDILELCGVDADYSGMARRYRQYQMEKGVCRPLRERIADNPYLGYAADAVEVRVRMGWKPVPTPVDEQTPETEPPMHVACTFDRVGELMEEFHRQGITKAQFCLVGWNKKGHDGRWPQVLPVEESLGGEEGLRRLVKKAGELGYKLVCHTNSSDAYRVADCWDEEYIIKNRDGSLSANETSWSGGRMYNVCPRRAWERFAEKTLEDVKSLGFSGLHYIDVLSVVPPRTCFDPAHPCTARESADYINRIFAVAREKIGGISSEGGFDFAAPTLDFALYIAFNLLQKHPDVCDGVIPLWELIYHGIILANPSSETVNIPVKGNRNKLKFYEYGGRPVIYYFSKFVGAGRENWMGDDDFLCTTDEELRRSVSAVKALLEEYAAYAHLQYAFMENHRKLDEGVFEAAYSTGERVIVNYTGTPYRCGDTDIPGGMAVLCR